MNGALHLPKHAADNSERSPASTNWVKRQWWKYSYSAQRASPPPRFVLVFLLSAQILFLAVVRLGPSASIWDSSGANPSEDPSVLYPFLRGNHAFMSHGASENQEHRNDKSETSSSTSNVMRLSDDTSVALPEEGSDGSSSSSSVSSSPSSEKGDMPKHKEEDNVKVTAKKKQPSVKKESKIAVQKEEKNVHGDDLLPSFDDTSLIDLGRNSEKDDSQLGAAIARMNKRGDEADTHSTVNEASKFSSMIRAQSNQIAKGGDDENDDKASLSAAVAEAQTVKKAKGNVKKDASLIEKQGSEGPPGKGKDESEKVNEVGPTESSMKPKGQSEKGNEVAVNRDTEKGEEQGEKGNEVLVKGEAKGEEKIGKGNDAHPGDSSVKQEEQAKMGDEVPAKRDAGSEGMKQKIQGAPSEDSKEHVDRKSEGAPSEDSKEHVDRKSEGEVDVKGTIFEKGSKLVPSREEPVLIKPMTSNKTSSSECGYGYIYVYDLPRIFNRDIVFNCTALNPWNDVCPTLANGGLGESLGETSPLGQVGSWYTTDQFMAEIVFHNRILQHRCLTDKIDKASGFYIPFYAGLDVGRYLWEGSSAERRDRVSNQFLDWLNDQPAWKKNRGSDHFMMIGRITWDFRRSKDEDWGSSLFHRPSMKNMTKLLIERNPWDVNEMAVPYTTNFHPQSDADLVAWQSHVRGLKRSNLFSFAGAPRERFPDDFRGILFEQCRQAEHCRSLDCSNRTCDDNQKTLELFMDSTFCLQPRGDSFTRRSTFDCLLAGSIPVFFWHRSAYLQYKWHLPADKASYSVFISKADMRNGTKIEDVLKSFSAEKVQAMREAVIQLIPRIVYASSGFALQQDDAFDVAIEGVMKGFKQLSVI